MALKVITPPASEPLDLATAKVHLRVDTTDDDALITSLITAARQYCEQYQNRAYVTQTLELTLDEFPDMPFDLPMPPLQSVTSIKYIDKDGLETTWDPANYIVDVDSQPGRIALAYGKTLPTVTLKPVNAVKIQFVAGYGATAAVPQTVKQAMLLLIGAWYEQREALVVGSTVTTVPFAVEALLWQDRVVTSL